MLKEFKIGNFLSFKNVQTLSLKSSDSKNGSILNSAFIYGPNASGKSNLIKAMKYSRDLICRIKSSFKPTPFINAENEYEKEPSYFEYVIKIDGKEYSYGFERLLNCDKIISEWLYELNNDGDRCIFELKYDEGYFNIENDSLRTYLNEYVKIPRYTSLWINDRGPQQKDPIYKKIQGWFKNSFIVETSEFFDECIPVPKNVIEYLTNVLGAFDTGITKVVGEPFRKKEIPINLTRRFEMSDDDQIVFIDGNSRKRYWVLHITGNKDDRQYYEVRFLHNSLHKSRIDEESLGTMRIIRIVTLLASQKNCNKEFGSSTLVIDEMECSIHPLIMNQIVDLFNYLNTPNTQLIATTHESRILTNEHLDRDMIWFVDSDYSGKDNDSMLYSLDSFEEIKGKIDSRYLEGRFAAIPVFRTPQLERE